MQATSVAERRVSGRAGAPAESRPSHQWPAGASATASADTAWAGLYRVGAAAALAVLLLMPVQIAVWLAWPPPATVEGFFALFRRSWPLGLLGLDLLYILTNALMLPLLLALGVALWRVSPSAVALALTLGLVSIAVLFASTVALEMLSLSNQHAAATTEAQRSLYLAAGAALLATYKGTAFAVYYLMNGAALLTIAAVMLRSTVFGRATAYAGLLAGALMVVPSTFGTLGLVFSLASLVPWAVFSVLITRRLWRLGRDAPDTAGIGLGPAVGEEVSA